MGSGASIRRGPHNNCNLSSLERCQNLNDLIHTFPKDVSYSDSLVRQKSVETPRDSKAVPNSRTKPNQNFSSSKGGRDSKKLKSRSNSRTKPDKAKHDLKILSEKYGH